MRKIIFNADDFNMTFGVCLGILRAIQLGVVRSASIMVNLPGLEECLSLARGLSLDLGLHINLTFGKPVLPAEKVPSLVDSLGNFWRKPVILKEKMRIEEAGLEIEAQLARAKEYKIPVSHIDSHHHSHTLEGIIDIYTDIAKREGLAARSNDSIMCRNFKEMSLKTPDNFIDSFYGEQNVSLENLKEIIRNIPDGISEVMCHPGFVDSGLELISSYTYQRMKELEALINPELIKFLSSLNIEFIGYRDIS